MAKKSTCILACGQLKICNLSPDNVKKHVTLMAATPEPAIWSSDIGQRIPCSDNCKLTSTWMCNIRMKAPTPVRKCEISHWLTCDADGQMDGRTDGHVTTKITRI